MLHRGLLAACLVVFSIVLIVGSASAQRASVFANPSDALVEEIELLPGVVVPVDIWDDDYVPTALDFVAIGFSENDAQKQEIRDCTWGQIKDCYNGHYNDCCPKKTQEG